jgi:hypothetical protein
VRARVVCECYNVQMRMSVVHDAVNNTVHDTVHEVHDDDMLLCAAMLYVRSCYPLYLVHRSLQIASTRVGRDQRPRLELFRG